MRILVISHTDHYLAEDGSIVGWGATVNEIDKLAERFGSVTHVACLHKGIPPASAVPYKSGKVRFVPIPPFGGIGLKSKLSIITSAPANIVKISRALKESDIFQFRAPTSIGLYIIPYLTLFTKKRGWYKYAGNWVAKKVPLSYAIQRWMLLNMQSKPITINGRWEHQPANCLSFENPCLDEKNRVDGLLTANIKDFNVPLRLCFVGRLDKEKGVDNILQALRSVNNQSLLSRLDIVGDGPYRTELENMAGDIQLPIQFHGALSREKVFEVYRNAHFILLPSRSEGFPKVVAEAANFGCIPIVSDISAIGQYVNNENGFLWNPTINSFTDFFSAIDFKEVASLKQKALSAHKMAAEFTYDHYLDKLERLIFNKCR